MRTQEQREQAVRELLDGTYLANQEGFADFINEAVNMDEVETRWLRNACKLWADWKENEEFVIDGVNHDPNHPDNLSHRVFKEWLEEKIAARPMKLVYQSVIADDVERIREFRFPTEARIRCEGKGARKGEFTAGFMTLVVKGKYKVYSNVVPVIRELPNTKKERK